MVQTNNNKRNMCRHCPKKEALKMAGEMDKLEDECGVIGIYAPNQANLSRLTYFGLHALQHRGQESAGIAVNQGGNIQYYKEVGLVQEVFNDAIIERLKGDIAIGHVKYGMKDDKYVANTMPLVFFCQNQTVAVALNGSLINAKKIKDELEELGAIFQTAMEVEVFASLITRHAKKSTVEEGILEALKTISGAYAMTLTYGKKLIGIRDPLGIRPLCLGKLDTGDYVLASESCAFSVMGAKRIRDIEPGEMVMIENNEVKSMNFSAINKKALCAFEYVYLARPDSVIDGSSVYMARRDSGGFLAKMKEIEGDMVIAVPDSGTVAAIGYAAASKLPFGEGLIKNRYIGRTFIQPDQRTRELSVHLKLNVLKPSVKNKRIIMVDDSIVRGTTCANIVKMLKEAGAKEVHVVVSSPPVLHPCYFGIDTPDTDLLIAANYSHEEIRDFIGADSLTFLSVEALVEAIGLGNESLCTACFDGDYPLSIEEVAHGR